MELLSIMMNQDEAIEFYFDVPFYIKYLAKIVDKTSQVKPIVIGMLEANSFSSLESMHYVRNRVVRITFIDEVVQFLQCVHNPGL